MARKKKYQKAIMSFIGGPMDGSDVTLKLEQNVDITLQPTEVPASVMVLFRACTYRVDLSKRRLYHIPLK
jgi:hypothetical protein